MGTRLLLEGISFAYPRKSPIYQGLSLEIQPGATVLLGPNGAGKSTLLSLCASVLRPRQGRILCESNAESISSDELKKFRRNVAWLPQHFEPVAGLSVEEHVAYAGWLKGMSRTAARTGARDALEQVGLLSLAQEPVKTLSGGQKRRLGLAGAVIHDAEMILLDEPSAGLDPLQRDRLRETIYALGEEKTILVSTHQTEDIDGTFANVVVLSDAQVRFNGTLREFVGSAGEHADPRDAIRAAYSRHVLAEI